MFPSLGARPISEIAPPELRMALRRIEQHGAIDTAYRALQKQGRASFVPNFRERADLFAR